MSGIDRGRAVLIGVTLAAMACGGEAGPAPAALDGNYGGRVLGVQAFLGLALRRSGSAVTGSAWSLFLPSPNHVASVSGTISNDSLALRMQVAGQPDWLFNGVWAADSLSGEIALDPRGGFLVTLTRVDTIPSNSATIAVRGAESSDASGLASFGYVSDATPVLLFEIAAPFPATFYFQFPGSARPATGVYSLGGNSPVSLSIVRDPSAPVTAPYAVTSGTLRIERANRFTLMGRLDATARGPGGAIISLTGTYSAGCVGDC